MRLRKGSAVVALTMAGALAATGCAGGSDGAGAAAVAGEPVWDEAAQQYVLEEEIASGAEALTVWVEYEEYGDALTAAFEAAYPGVRLEYEVVAKVDAVGRMALDGEAGKGADVVTANYDKLAEAIDSSIAAPLGRYDEVVTERVGEDFASVASRDGELYGVPISTESLALFTNTTLLEQLTGSPEPATDWDQVRALAAQYNDPASNRWTIRFLAGELYYAYPVLSSLGWQLYPGGDLDAPGLDDPALAEGLAYYAGLREVWDVNSADATYDFIENEFIKGETPYVVTGPWAFGDFDAAAAERGFEYAVSTLPAVPGGEDAATLAGMGVALVSGYSRYPAASRVLAAFMASPEGAEALYSSTGAIPAVAAEHIADVDGLAEDEHAAGVLAQSQHADFLAQIPEYGYTAGNELVATVWDGVLPVAEAQERAVAAYAELADLAQ